MKKVCKRLICFLHRIFSYFICISESTILFESYQGHNYSGNPKYIYEELVRQGLDEKYDCVWIFKNKNIVVPGRCVKINKRSFHYFFYLCKARLWIFDSLAPGYVYKKSGITYLQTWHGTPLKKIGLDMQYVNMKGYHSVDEYKDEYKSESEKWDILLSQNEYSTNIFKSAFAFDKEIWETGYPRNDVLFKMNTEENRSQLKEKLGLPKDKMIILYAPTWRDDNHYLKSGYRFNIPFDLQNMKTHLEKDFILLLKPHFFVAEKVNTDEYGGFVRFFKASHDIQELYLAADILITDYSSVMFDFSILKRPVILYLHDIDSYKSNCRDLYFDILEEAPGKIVTSYDELLSLLLHKEYAVQDKRYLPFVEKYNAKESGDSAKKVLEKLHL